MNDGDPRGALEAEIAGLREAIAGAQRDLTSLRSRGARRRGFVPGLLVGIVLGVATVFVGAIWMFADFMSHYG
jgi:hypothetical protein